MQDRFSRRALLLAAVSGVAALTGCSQPERSRARLDYWADQLQMRAWGEVTVEDYAGSNNFSDTTPTLTLLTASSPTAVMDHAARTLTARGFNFKGDDWHSQGAREYRTVNIRPLSRGTRYYLPGAKRTLTLSKPTVRISLQVSDSA